MVPVVGRLVQYSYNEKSKDVTMMLVMIMIMTMIMFVAFLVSVGGILISQLKT